MFWELLAIAASIAILELGKRLGKVYLPHYLIGLFYGLWWELSAEPLFNYNGFAIYLWRDVPLAIILFWGVVIVGLVKLSDFGQYKFKLIKNKLANCLVWDILTASAVGWTLEFTGSKILNLWSYSELSIGPLLAGLPVCWLVSWTFVGLFMLTFARRYHSLLKW